MHRTLNTSLCLLARNTRALSLCRTFPKSSSVIVQWSLNCHSFSTEGASSSNILPESLFKSDLKVLRHRTGAPLKECKKALTAILEGNDDDNQDRSVLLSEDASDTRIEYAIDWLRVSGVKVASKKSGQTAANGFISVVNLDHRCASIVEVNCVTDFVEKNPLFIQTVENIAYTVAKQDDSLTQGQFKQNLSLLTDEETADLSSVDEEEKVAMKLMADLTVYDLKNEKQTDQKLGAALTDIISSIRENLVFRRFSKFQASSNGVICHYVHSRSTPYCGMKGGIVHLEPVDDSALFDMSDCIRQSMIELGTNIAMHAVTNGNRPQFLSDQDVPESIIERERKIAMDTAMAENTDLPAEKLLKIVDGRVKKYLSEVCLSSQTFCLADDSASSVPISKLIEKTCKSNKIPNMKLANFTVFALGDCSA